MRRKGLKSRKDQLTLVVAGLFGVASLLLIYLVQTTDELIKVREINAANSSKIVLPSETFTKASCGT